MFAGFRLLLPVSTNCVTLVPKPGRKEGHAVREPSLLRRIAVLRMSGSRKKRRPPVVARGGGAGAIEEQVGRKAYCRAPGSWRGGCRPRGSGGVGAIHQEAGACCHPLCLGRSREQGTRCRLPSTGGAIAIHQEADERRAVNQRCPGPSHGTTSESLSAGSSGRIKGGATTMEDKRRPRLDFYLCFVCGSHPLGAADFLLYLFILLLKSVNVCRFPPTSSSIYELCYNNLVQWFSNLSWSTPSPAHLDVSLIYHTYHTLQR